MLNIDCLLNDKKEALKKFGLSVWCTKKPLFDSRKYVAIV